MLYPEKVRKALEASLPSFQEWHARYAEEVDAYAGGLDTLGELGADEIAALMEGKSNPGALPSEEHGSPIVIRFPHRFTCHQEARAWAFQRIRGITTLAVDGSQIRPTKDYSVAVGAIQTAWFINPHTEGGGRYVKGAAFELLPPSAQQEDGEGETQPSQDVNLRRFEAEIRKITECMRSWQGREPKPVAFFDGSLVVSFAAPLPERLRTRYVRGVLDLLRASEEHRVPVVGFVDTSHARDICTLLQHVRGLRKPESVNDGRLFRGRMEWGDRSRAFVCAREHILKSYSYPEEEGGANFSDQVAFFYLQTTGGGPPARVDVPRWVVREGLVEHVADVIRCEVIAGTGYPYCFEAVDAAAVLSVPDREAFYAEVADFFERHGMRLRLAPKAASKRRRRL